MLLQIAILLVAALGGAWAVESQRRLLRRRFDALDTLLSGRLSGLEAMLEVELAALRTTLRSAREDLVGVGGRGERLRERREAARACRGEGTLERWVHTRRRPGTQPESTAPRPPPAVGH